MRLLDATMAVVAREGPQALPQGLSAWCRENGIPRATAYRHLRRIKREGSWQPKSRRPATCPHTTEAVVREEIIAIRQRLMALAYADIGADVVRAELEPIAAEHGWPVPARSTVHSILAQADLVAPHPKKRPRASYRRFTYARPRDCYQIDGTDVSDLVGFRAVVLEVLDDHSRVLVGTHAAMAETAAAACSAMRQAIGEYGPPALVLADNGLAFSNRFSPTGAPTSFLRLVNGPGGRVIHSSPYHPQTCGKVERHHQTFKKWLRAQAKPRNLEELNVLIQQYRRWYNTKRWNSVWRRAPQKQWDNAPELGGPKQMPIQTDATVLTVKVTRDGAITVRSAQITVGLPHAGQRLTALLDGNHLTVYGPDGTPLGHINLDYSRLHQGRLTAA